MDVSVLIGSGRPWAEIVRVARAADEAGAHAVYIPDHFMPNTADDSIVDGGRLEAWTLLSALSQQTTSCRLGALVLGAGYRHPAVVANMAAALDHVSSGRAIAGLGAGWQVNEHAAYGIDLLSDGDRSDRFEESVHVVASLLRERRTTFDGRYYQLHDAPNQPEPVQERLPVLVAGKGERRTLRTAAKYAEVWHTWARRSRSRPRAPCSTSAAPRSIAIRPRSGAPPASSSRTSRTERPRSRRSGTCATSSSSATWAPPLTT